MVSSGANGLQRWSVYLEYGINRKRKVRLVGDLVNVISATEGQIRININA